MKRRDFLPFILLLLAGCKRAPTPAAPAPIPVPVAAATSENVQVTGEWVATMDGYVNAQIQPQASGYLVRQNYTEGSVVQKDQVLFEIDPRPLQAVADQTAGTLAQAQAQMELAAINVQRDTPLAAAHALAQSTLDTELKTLEADKAAVTTARANVEAAELNVGFTKVRSLIGGVAGLAQLQVGSLVGATSVLTSVSQLDPIKVYFFISEQEYLALSTRMRTSGQGDLVSSGNRVPLTLTLSNGKVYPHKGRIIFVDRSVTAQTGSLKLAASFANPGNFLRPGQFGRVTAETEVLRGAVLIPQRAVNVLQGLDQVVVVTPDNTAHVKTVQLGPQKGQKVVVSSGLSAGDEVVTEGLDKLKDGMKVNPQQPGAKLMADAAHPKPTAAPAQRSEGK
jgi:membrane fusion protein (multidrug efflux system)